MLLGTVSSLEKFLDETGILKMYQCRHFPLMCLPYLVNSNFPCDISFLIFEGVVLNLHVVRL